MLFNKLKCSFQRIYYKFWKNSLLMRPLTAAKKYDVSTTKSIWKKYDILKP